MSRIAISCLRTDCGNRTTDPSGLCHHHRALSTSDTSGAGSLMSVPKLSSLSDAVVDDGDDLNGDIVRITEMVCQVRDIEARRDHRWKHSIKGGEEGRRDGKRGRHLLADIARVVQSRGDLIGEEVDGIISRRIDDEGVAETVSLTDEEYDRIVDQVAQLSARIRAINAGSSDSDADVDVDDGVDVSELYRQRTELVSMLQVRRYGCYIARRHADAPLEMITSPEHLRRIAIRREEYIAALERRGIRFCSEMDRSLLQGDDDAIDAVVEMSAFVPASWVESSNDIIRQGWTTRIEGDGDGDVDTMGQFAEGGRMSPLTRTDTHQHGSMIELSRYELHRWDEIALHARTDGDVLRRGNEMQ